MKRVDLDCILRNLLRLNDQLGANLVFVYHFNPSLVKVERLEAQIVSQCDQMTILVVKLHLYLVEVLFDQDVGVLQVQLGRGHCSSCSRICEQVKTHGPCHHELDIVTCMQLLKLVHLGHVSHGHTESVREHDIDATFSSVVQHGLVDNLDVSFSFRDTRLERSIILDRANLSIECRPLEVRVWDLDRPILHNISALHVNVRQTELELASRQDVDRLGRQNDEGVNDSEALRHQLHMLVAWLLQLDLHSRKPGLHTPNEEVVGVVGVAGACVRRRELLDNIVALGDAPVEAEAVHCAEDVIIVIVAHHCHVVVAVHAELLRTRENVEFVDFAHFCVALQHGARVFNKAKNQD